MSEVLKAVLLGIIQGLTEFLPVSSSGHLEIGKYFLGTDLEGQESLLLSVVLHAATALSTIWVFRQEIADIIRGIFTKSWNEDKKFAVLVIISMIPAGLVGFFLEDQLTTLFDGKIVFVALMLIVTAFLLLISDYAKRKEGNIKYSDSLIIGISQAVALFPGISRSGATISTALLLGLDKTKAATFSFLMVLPLILGKMGKDILNGTLSGTEMSSISLGAGFIAAFLAGVFACTWMIKLVKNSKLRYFAIYCFVLATLVLISFYIFP